MLKITGKIKKYSLIMIGLIAGYLGGYLYYYFIGCYSGTCPITSKLLNSMAYGALIGVLFISIFRKQKL